MKDNTIPTLPNITLLSEHGYFSFCLFKCRLIDFSQEQNQILRLQTSFCQFQTWLLPGLRKMLTSGIFQHKMVSQCWWALQFCWTHVVFCCCGRCLSHYYVALWCYLADVIALLPYYATFVFCLADVIALLHWRLG